MPTLVDPSEQILLSLLLHVPINNDKCNLGFGWSAGIASFTMVLFPADWQAKGTAWSSISSGLLLLLCATLSCLKASGQATHLPTDMVLELIIMTRILITYLAFSCAYTFFLIPVSTLKD